MRVTNDPKEKIYKFRATEQMAKKIDEYCAKRAISVSDLLRNAVSEYLKKQ